MKKVLDRAMRRAAGVALSVASLSILATLCRTWLYQPPMAAHLLADE